MHGGTRNHCDEHTTRLICSVDYQLGDHDEHATPYVRCPVASESPCLKTLFANKKRSRIWLKTTMRLIDFLIYNDNWNISRTTTREVPGIFELKIYAARLLVGRRSHSSIAQSGTATATLTQDVGRRDTLSYASCPNIVAPRCSIPAPPAASRQTSQKCLSASSHPKFALRSQLSRVQ